MKAGMIFVFAGVALFVLYVFTRMKGVQSGTGASAPAAVGPFAYLLNDSAGKPPASGVVSQGTRASGPFAYLISEGAIPENIYGGQSYT
jgi:hypothetical protein